MSATELETKGCTVSELIVISQNKFSFQEVHSDNLIFDKMKISSHIMKDIRVANKIRICDVLLYDKIKIFILRWVRRAFQQLISHQKALVLAANSLMQDHDYPPKAGSLHYSLKI